MFLPLILPKLLSQHIRRLLPSQTPPVQEQDLSDSDPDDLNLPISTDPTPLSDPPLGPPEELRSVFGNDHRVFIVLQPFSPATMQHHTSRLFPDLRVLDMLQPGDHVRGYAELLVEDPALPKLIVCSVFLDGRFRTGVYPLELVTPIDDIYQTLTLVSVSSYDIPPVSSSSSNNSSSSSSNNSSSSSSSSSNNSSPSSDTSNMLRLLNLSHTDHQHLWSSSSSFPCFHFDRPTTLPPGYATFGDRCRLQESRHTFSPTSAMLAVRLHPTLTAYPVAYQHLWSHRKSFSIWLPLAPPGFVVLGAVCSLSASHPPSLQQVVCLHASAALQQGLALSVDLSKWSLSYASKALFLAPVTCSLLDFDLEAANGLSTGTFLASNSPSFADYPFLTINKAFVHRIGYAIDDDDLPLRSTTRPPLPLISRFHYQMLLAKHRVAHASYLRRIYHQLKRKNCNFWTKREITYLFRSFQAFSRNGYVTRHTRQYLTDDNQALFAGLMLLADIDRNSAVGFKEFARFLGMIIRGSLDMRSELTFRCLDIHRRGLITLDHVQQFLTELVDAVPRVLNATALPALDPLETSDIYSLISECIATAQAMEATGPTSTQAVPPESTHEQPPTDHRDDDPDDRTTPYSRDHGDHDLHEANHRSDSDNTLDPILSASLSSPAPPLPVDPVGASSSCFTFDRISLSLSSSTIDQVDSLSSDDAHGLSLPPADLIPTSPLVPCAHLRPPAPSSAMSSTLVELEMAKFNPRTSRKTILQVDLAEWQARIALNPMLGDCFGLFRLFYILFVIPMEMELYSSHFHRTTFSGQLNGVTFRLNHRFLAEFPDDAATPTRVFNITDIEVHTAKQLLLLKLPYRRRFIPLRAPSSELAQVWHHTILFNSHSDFPFRSFAPVRFMTPVRFFITAAAYFQELAVVLRRARRRVYIADWALSPGLYLTRGQGQADKANRLDRLLQEVASRGVQIYILVWHASPVAMKTLDIGFVLNYLPSLHPNIHLQTHPIGVKTLYAFWSHHQKFLILDEEICFLGGLDLCYGRFDQNHHPILDPEGRLFPGKDYMNYNYNPDTNGPTNRDQLPRNRLPRMGWEDIHSQFTGKAVRDVARNFIERWNWARHESRKRMIAQKIPHLFPLDPSDCQQTDYIQALHQLPSSTSITDPGPLMPTRKLQILRSVSKWSIGSGEEASIYSAYISAIQTAERFIYIENQYFISSRATKNRIAEVLFHRICKAIHNHEAFRCIIVLPIYPATPSSNVTRYIHYHHLKTISRGRHSLIGRIKSLFPGGVWKNHLSFCALRTFSYWNPREFHAPTRFHEPAIVPLTPTAQKSSYLPMAMATDRLLQAEAGEAAYLKLPVGVFLSPDITMIKTVKISSGTTFSGLAQELNARILEQFPAEVIGSSLVFSTELVENSTCWREFPANDHLVQSALREFASEHRSMHLRVYYGLPRFPVTEQIYVHSKLLIADDKLVILGSANINDRSLLGSRDSEIGFILRDVSHMGVASCLRKRIFCKFLGLAFPRDAQRVEDPTTDAFWQLWNGQARRNASIYKAVFPSILESARNFPDSPLDVPHNHLPHQVHRLHDIQGFLVKYPKKSGQTDKLKPPMLSGEGVVPTEVFI